MDPEEEATCGKGVAASAELPDRMAAFLRATADMLESHIRSLDPDEAAGRLEAEAYQRLVAEHRVVGDRLQALAGLMRSYRDLPLAAHDMAVLVDPHSVDVFAAAIDREKELVALMQSRVEEYSAMLGEMKG